MSSYVLISLLRGEGEYPLREGLYSPVNSQAMLSLDRRQPVDSPFARELLKGRASGRMEKAARFRIPHSSTRITLDDHGECCGRFLVIIVSGHFFVLFARPGPRKISSRLIQPLSPLGVAESRLESAGAV